MNFWVLSLDVKINDTSHGIVGVYRSPNGNINVFFEYFLKWLNDYCEEHSNHSVIITGDFNISL